MEESFNAFIVDIDSLLKITNRHIVILHILVHQATLNIHSLVFWELLHHPRKLIQRILELTCAPKHQALVKHR